MTGPAEGKLELKGADGLLNAIIKPGEMSFVGWKRGRSVPRTKKRDDKTS